MKISQIIREKRKQLGLTQENVAEYLGVSIPAVSKWENGTTYPDIMLLPALARLLRTDLNTLIQHRTLRFCQSFEKVFEKTSEKPIQNTPQNVPNPIDIH